MWDSTSRMLKKSASGVLASRSASTYAREYASASSLAAALLDGLFEHPVCAGSHADRQALEILLCRNSFVTAYEVIR